MAYTNTWTTAAPLDTQAANQGAVDFRALKLDTMQRISSFGAGLLANIPTPEVNSASANWTGVMYWATDTLQAFRWNGSSWDDISTSLPTGTAVALATTGASVNVNLAAPPTVGEVLTATSATTATWQGAVAVALATTGASVNVSSAAPPTVGQILIATDATHATWQTLPLSYADVAVYNYITPTTNQIASHISIPVGVLSIGSIITIDADTYSDAPQGTDTITSLITIGSTQATLGVWSGVGGSYAHIVLVFTSNTTYTALYTLEISTGSGTFKITGTCPDITTTPFDIHDGFTAGAGPNAHTYDFDFLSAVVS